MVRWEPDSRERLERAALELYAERGFENTTVAEIAERAGLTERTFFRHYADKREVLFGGASLLQEAMTAAVAHAPASADPIQAAAAGLEACAQLIGGRPDFARRRQAIIAASQELRERELIKLADLSAALAETLRQRGVAEPAASLTADLAVAVFRVAFQRWHEAGERRDLSALLRDSLDQMRAVAGATR